MCVFLRCVDHAYAAMRDDGANCPVLVYVSTADIDSCCAFRTLKLMLWSDNVPFSVFPVSGYGELERYGSEIPDDGNQRAIVLINCGGTEDVKKVMGLKAGARAYVFDSHRPLDLENVREGNGDVLVMRDDREGNEVFPEPDSDEDDDSDSDEDEDEGANAGGDSPRTRRLKLAERQRERIAYYSRGSFYGRATGMLMYDIAYKMSKDKLENYLPLWLAVLSLTDQYVHQRLSHESYTSCVMELATRVSAMSNADMPTTRSLEDGTVVKAFDERRITYNEEYRFMLLRHWSLYESMLHSSYVATKMQTWTERGRANLRSLFAHVGIPLDVAQQKYSHMSPQAVKQFEEKLDEHAESHMLDDVKFWSFQYSHGYAMKVCAADVVYGATALLEGLMNDKDDKSITPADNFWRAAQSLSLTNWDEMEAGIGYAIRLQQAVMRQGGMALSSRAHIRTIGSLRYFSLIDHGSPADVKLFKHPLSLLKLALFIQDALRTVRRIVRPLVVIGPSPEDPTLALIVGVTGKPNTDNEGGGNFFTHSFKMAAERVHARFKHDSFEASVVQVAERDLGSFMEALSDLDAERLARSMANEAD